jgi:excisionase family DNA binding protein
MPEKLLRIEEAAELLGYAPFTVRRWLRDGKLRGVKTADHQRGRWRVPESAVVELQSTFTPNRKAKTDTSTD